jgi:MGT family glycosyltransferase
MSRFLFVVPPLVGHINPTVGLAARLTEPAGGGAGHEVAWAGHPELVPRLVGDHATVFPCAVPDAGSTSREADLRGPAALKFLWEAFLIPLAETMMPGVNAAVEAFKPDVMVVDQQAVAGAVVAERLGIPWATSATTAAELADPLGGMPKVAAWVREMLLGLEIKHGDPNAAQSERYQRTYGDLRFSPSLVIAYSTEELSGRRPELAETLRYVGPSIAERPSDPDFPWHALPAPGEKPLVLISVGTANVDASGDFLRSCAEAVAARPGIFAVIVDPGHVLTDVPANALTAPHVPQLELLSRGVNAVICHSGQNTVCEALYHGIPLVLAPIRDDQPIVAQQAVDAGVAERIRFARARAEQIGTALDRILTQPGYRAAAERVAASFKAAGGAAAAARHLVGISTSR